MLALIDFKCLDLSNQPIKITLTQCEMENDSFARSSAKYSVTFKFIFEFVYFVFILWFDFLVDKIKYIVIWKVCTQ